MSEHTPTPWFQDGSYVTDRDDGIIGRSIADCAKSPNIDRATQQANAAFIVKAVNNHSALVDALLSLDTLLDFGDDALDNVWTFEDLTSIQAAFDKARAALERVTGDVLIKEKMT